MTLRGVWSWVKRWSGAWVELWDRREAPHALVLVRIGVAVVLLADLLATWRHDLIELLWAPPPDGIAIINMKDPPWSVRWFGAGPELAFGLWLASVISACAIAFGALTRVACVVFVFVYAQLSILAPDSDRGIDILLRIVVGILAFSACNARWSIDAWVRRGIGRPMPETVPAWPRYLLFAQLIWMYFSSGHSKVGLEWYPHGGFTALGNVLSDPHFARFDPGWVEAIHPLTRVMTAATMLFELAAPLVILFTWWNLTADRPGRLRRWSNRLRLRWAWIAIGVGFHLGIALTMRLGIFPWGVLAIYPVLFHPTEIERAATRLFRR